MKEKEKLLVFGKEYKFLSKAQGVFSKMAKKKKTAKKTGKKKGGSKKKRR